MKKKTDKISKFDRPEYRPPKRFVRPGSMDVLEAPSRIHNTLFYPDGTTKHDNQASNKNNKNS
jgi:hypothetical protein